MLDSRAKLSLFSAIRNRIVFTMFTLLSPSDWLCSLNKNARATMFCSFVVEASKRVTKQDSLNHTPKLSQPLHA